VGYKLAGKKTKGKIPFHAAKYYAGNGIAGIVLCWLIPVGLQLLRCKINGIAPAQVQALQQPGIIIGTELDIILIDHSIAVGKVAKA